MPTSADLVLVDTSAAIPLIQAADPAGIALREFIGTRRVGLAGHAAFETYSVLTRRPTPNRVSARAAARLIEDNFPESRQLSAGVELITEFAALGIDGGAVYDGLVAAAAREHGALLLTRDVRAERTYRLLGVNFRSV